MATVVKIACRTLFENHLYEFGGRTYRQKVGGPIGLRATCAIARLVMCTWDKLWAIRLNQLGIKTELKTRYMDYGRAVLHPIRHGWRWVEGEGLKYCQAWAEQDGGLSPVEVTSKVLGATMNNLVDGIKFTVESRLDHDGVWLPTLDVSLSVTSDSRIRFKYYEKEVSTNTVIHQRTALEDNTKMQILSQEMSRRMLNTSEEMDKETKLGVIDMMAKKMRTSGYTISQTRRAISNGLKFYEEKKARCKRENRPLYRTASSSLAGRYKKKLLGKTTWYKKRRKFENPSLEQLSQGRGNKRKRVNAKGSCQDLETKSVIFVENTPGGELAKRLKSLLERLQYHLGCKVKVVERAGTKLKDLFPLNKLWEGAGCGRPDCYPCVQGTEDTQNCKKRNIVYESICTSCNPSAMKRGSLKNYDGSKPSLYVGETARSLKERSKEHLDAFRTGSQTSHIRAHQDQCHGGSQDINFVFKIWGRQDLPLAGRWGRQSGSEIEGERGQYLMPRGNITAAPLPDLHWGRSRRGRRPNLKRWMRGRGNRHTNGLKMRGKTGS